MSGDTFDEQLFTWRDRIGSIPRLTDWVCPWCCGPKWSEYAVCFGCSRIFREAPAALRTMIVPITCAREEGWWYHQLLAYKTASAERWPFLRELVIRFVDIHQRSIASLLGGAPTASTVVPSKRGRRVNAQPLFRLLQGVAPSAPGAFPLPSVLVEHTGDAAPRQTYAPTAFRLSTRTAIRGARIILVEDSWASGTTAVSAAGALLDAGASVVILPIARLINTTYWKENHPYVQAMQQPFDITRWPRGQ